MKTEQRVGSRRLRGSNRTGHAQTTTGRPTGPSGPLKAGRSTGLITEPSRLTRGPDNRTGASFQRRPGRCRCRWGHGTPAGFRRSERVSPRTQRSTSRLGRARSASACARPCSRRSARLRRWRSSAVMAPSRLVPAAVPGAGRRRSGRRVPAWDRLHGTPTGSRILLVWAVLDVLRSRSRGVPPARRTPRSPSPTWSRRLLRGCALARRAGRVPLLDARRATAWCPPRTSSRSRS